MGDARSTDLTHFLDETGQLAPMPRPARRRAEYFTAIVLMASYPEIVIPPQYQVRCRRRPARRPCPGTIEADTDFETDEIIWCCPVCGDHGYIRNWKETMWDLSHNDELQ